MNRDRKDFMSSLFPYKTKAAFTLFDPSSQRPFRISRSRIDRWLECPRCFYLEWRRGVGRPSMPGFSLNNAVDALLKKEFDIHRARGTAHPLMQAYGLDAVPFDHAQIDAWRDALRRGITYLHPPTNLLITGGLDDVWTNATGELMVVDYKATATSQQISLDDGYKSGYKKQVEVYQWLLRQNGFTVSSVAYFVFVNGQTDREAFDGKLEFEIQLISHTGDDRWVEPTIYKIHECLMSDQIPAAGNTCEYCGYRAAAAQAMGEK